MLRVNELIVYRNFEDGDILNDMVFLMDHYKDEYYNREDIRALLFDCINRLVELAGSHGFEDNLWHMYLTYLLANNENAYSTACEIRGAVEGNINDLVHHDFVIFKELYDYDFAPLEEALKVNCFTLLADYRNQNEKSKVFNRRISERLQSLSRHLGAAADSEAFGSVLTTFYKEFGVGKLGLHKAFRVERDAAGEAEIVPITNIAHVKLNDLVGYEIPKQKLIDNTEAFVAGRQANNCLLFGDAGTGKSSSIKAILNQYYEKGLRIIEIYKHQFQDINSVIAQVKNRNYKFILYLDDLSFEEHEIEYKYLKAVIEGGLERKPDNVLIYATSNRRHLVREEFADKIGRRDDLHASDTVQEKLSLFARFGVSIFFTAPDKKEFEAIVTTLARRNGLEMEREELLAEANKWEMNHGGRTGRTAQQFIDYLLGRQK